MSPSTSFQAYMSARVPWQAADAPLYFTLALRVAGLDASLTCPCGLTLEYSTLVYKPNGLTRFEGGWGINKLAYCV